MKKNLMKNSVIKHSDLWNPASAGMTRESTAMRPYLQLSTYYLPLLSLLTFLAPTNLFWKILPNYGYVGGLQIDYLIPKLYMSDVVCLMIVGVWITQTVVSGRLYVVSRNNVLRFYLPLTTYYLLLFFRQFFTPSPISAIWFFVTTSLHIVTFCIGVQWMQQIGFEHIKKTLVIAIACTVLFQSLIGLYQFSFQQQLIGFLFFGEPQLTHDIGLAKADWSWVDKMFGTSLGFRTLPYGTTAHPNILAGFLALSLLTVLSQLTTGLLEKKGLFLLYKPIKKTLLIFSFALGVLVLILSLSISAWLAFIVGLLFIFLQRFAEKTLKRVVLCLLFLSLTIPVFLNVFAVKYENNLSITRRDQLNAVSFQIFNTHPLLGIGLNQFTAVNEHLPIQKEVVRFAQPAHNVLLLSIAEIGLLGVLILTLFLRSVSRHLENIHATHRVVTLRGTYLLLFAVILPILALDHYFYTLVPGQLILITSGWSYLICFNAKNKSA